MFTNIVIFRYLRIFDDNILLSIELNDFSMRYFVSKRIIQSIVLP